VSRLRSDLGIEIPLRDVFLHPVVSDLAALVESRLLDEIDSLSDDEARSQLE
jgi:hypothetical protein